MSAGRVVQSRDGKRVGGQRRRRPGAPGWSRRRWPTVVGLGFAALLSADLASGLDLAPVLAASTVVYLGSAAIGRRGAAWPVFFLTVVVLTLAKVLGAAELLGHAGAATWVVLAVGVLLAVWGLWHRQAVLLASRAQVLGFVGFGAAAVAAWWLSPTLGGLLVAGGLLAHAAWDVVHHRSGRVVVRSMAEFCAVLDVALAVVIVGVTLG